MWLVRTITVESEGDIAVKAQASVSNFREPTLLKIGIDAPALATQSPVRCTIPVGVVDSEKFDVRLSTAITFPAVRLDNLLFGGACLEFDLREIISSIPAIDRLNTLSDFFAVRHVVELFLL